MSLHPEPIRPVPEQTVRVARAAFPKGTTYTRMRDELGVVWHDEDFTGVFPTRGQPALAPWRLALVTVMQFAENLSDRQAAEAVRARIDWKYALGLELTDPGFDFSVLSEFRSRLLSGGAEELLLEKLLEECANLGLVKGRGKQRTDSTHVLAAIRGLNRLECVGETMRAALNALAAADAGWLAGWAPREWYERYGPRFEEYRLPKADAERRKLAEAIGEDGFRLLGELEGSAAALAGRLREIYPPWGSSSGSGRSSTTGRRDRAARHGGKAPRRCRPRPRRCIPPTTPRPATVGSGTSRGPATRSTSPRPMARRICRT